MVKDVVCGMEVDEANAQYKCEHNGKMYYFCAKGCQTEFENDPAKFEGSAGHDCGCGCGH